MTTLICYPKCSTCRKAEQYLKELGVTYVYRDIQKENPSKEELKAWQKASGLPLKRFFNTSGMKYRELNLKNRIPAMSEEEQFDLRRLPGEGIRGSLQVNYNRKQLYINLKMPLNKGFSFLFAALETIRTLFGEKERIRW